jgi:methionyl-tRNA formyltransferase
MLSVPDTGDIISVKRFPLHKTDTVSTLRNRTMIYTLVNFYEVMHTVFEGAELPSSAEHWSRPPYTRKDLLSLMQLESNMPLEELQRRIRATAHPDYPGPYLEIQGRRFTLKEG